jgi:hypothetical protein
VAPNQQANTHFSIVLNDHSRTEDKIDDVRERVYEELEHIFIKFSKYHMKILLGDFNAKVGREALSKPTIKDDHATSTIG